VRDQCSGPAGHGALALQLGAPNFHPGQGSGKRKVGLRFAVSHISKSRCPDFLYEALSDGHECGFH
jgi:hypothetical protein